MHMRHKSSGKRGCLLGERKVQARRWSATKTNPVVRRPQEPESFIHIPRKHLRHALRKHDYHRECHPQQVIGQVVYSDCRGGRRSSCPNQAGRANRKTKCLAGTREAASSDAEPALRFDASFASGNLEQAVHVYDREYDLLLQPDSEDREHVQWFCWSVQGAAPGKAYKFNILNNVKHDSQFNHGMKPVVHAGLPDDEGTNWRRAGDAICYYMSGTRAGHRKRPRYTLTFTLTFVTTKPYYVAYCFPYTYRQLQSFLARLESDSSRVRSFQRSLLCRSVGGRRCDVLRVGEDIDRSPIQSLPGGRGKPSVVITARVHPGETNSSWVMHGIIDTLTGGSDDAKVLRQNFDFWLVPMLNPDGVEQGYSRTCPAGLDLNRKWKRPSRVATPTIHHTKCLVKRVAAEDGLILYLDLHGHSRKHNAFLYGCDARFRGDHLYLYERVFPKLLSQVSELVSYRDCTFKVSQGKRRTARVVVSRECSLVNSFTLECSFHGVSFGRLKGTEFTVHRFKHLGADICGAVLDLCDLDDGHRRRGILREIQEQRIRAAVRSGGADSGSDGNDTSDSGPEDFDSDCSSLGSDTEEMPTSSPGNLSATTHGGTSDRRSSDLPAAAGRGVTFPSTVPRLRAGTWTGRPRQSQCHAKTQSVRQPCAPRVRAPSKPPRIERPRQTTVAQAHGPPAASDSKQTGSCAAASGPAGMGGLKHDPDQQAWVRGRHSQRRVHMVRIDQMVHFNK